jgi:hypothetical protein
MKSDVMNGKGNMSLRRPRVLIALLMEAASTSETSVNFY